VRRWCTRPSAVVAHGQGCCAAVQRGFRCPGRQSRKEVDRRPSRSKRSGSSTGNHRASSERIPGPIACGLRVGERLRDDERRPPRSPSAPEHCASKVKRVLEQLFSRDLRRHLGEPVFRSGFLNRWDKAKRVCSSRRFPAYFTFGIGGTFQPIRAGDLDRIPYPDIARLWGYR